MNDVEETEGFIIDWPKGIVAERPAGMQHYEVIFQGKLPGERLAYKVIYMVPYEFDSSTEQGYVYLPGPSDEAAKFNGGMWHGHVYEGHWLRGTSEWEKFARRFAKVSAPAPTQR